MKRLILIIFSVVLMSLFVSPINAFNLDADGPHVLAKYLSGSTQLFGATRIGDDFVTELDTIVMDIYDKLPESLEIPLYSLSDLIRDGLADEGLDWDAISPLLGKYAAVGVEADASLDFDDAGLFTIIVEITDQQGVDDLLNDLLQDVSDFPDPILDGDRIIYEEEGEGKLMITPTLLIVTNNADYTPNVDPPLSTNPDFMDALNTLPADDYHMLLYVSETLLEIAMSQGDMQDLQEIGFNPKDAGAIAAGFTIIDGSTFVFDASIQTTTPMTYDGVDIEFLSTLPATTDAFGVGTDLTAIYNNILSWVKTISAETGGSDRTADIEAAFAITGMDLQDDVLSWTTGNFGFFWGVDLTTMLDDLIATGTLTDLVFDAGIVIEATDLAKAQNLAQQLGVLLTQMVGSEEGVSVTQEDGMTRIVLEFPIDSSQPPMEIELILTATEDFFYLGTANAFDAIMSGNTLASDPDFVKASEHFLDNPSTVFYGNADGALSSMAPNLLIMSGPVVGNVFTEVLPVAGSSSQMIELTPSVAIPTEAVSQDDSESEEVADTDTESTMDSDMDDGMAEEMQVMMDVLAAYDDILSNTTFTTSVDDTGVVRLRGTMTLNQ